MKFIYVLSIIYLLILFLLYKKYDKKICILSSIVYSVCLLFCFNTFIIYLLYLLGIKGSLGIYSLINYLFGSIIGVVILKNKRKFQKYYFDKKKFVIFFCLAIIVFLVCYFKFRGFDAIAYESGDSAIHYKHALKFSEELSILDEFNSRDPVYGYFKRVLPISYVNCGLLLNVFSTEKTYGLYTLYNVFCLILSALLFLVTIMDIFKYHKKDYIFGLVFTLFYIMAFPLNSFIMGFCYLTLSLMVINLLYYTIYRFKDSFDKNIIYKISVISIISFSVFYSYSLFMPAIYLALGLYYIYLWKKQKLSFIQTGIYGVITLIIPFIMGFQYFFITLFEDIGVEYVGNAINSWGYSYDNITPIYLLSGMLIYLVFDYKKNKKIDYLKINIYIITGYIMLFFILYMFNRADLYYFYKLFFMYWLFVVIYLGKNIFRVKKYFYGVLVGICLINIIVYIGYGSVLSLFFTKTNIYSWNTNTFVREKLLFDRNEVQLMEESVGFEEQCDDNGKFLVLGNVDKNIWFYSVTNNIPVFNPINGNVRNLYSMPNLTLDGWGRISEYDCAVYFYENEKQEIDELNFEVLYENDGGAILKRRNS